MWKQRKNKFGNKKVRTPEHTFDSKHEYYYYLYLKEREKKGEISDLQLQVKFEIVPAVFESYVAHFVRKPDEVRTKKVQDAVYYIADFVYTDTATGLQEVVDAKCEATKKDSLYVLKKKMMRAFLHIEIIEV